MLPADGAALSGPTFQASCRGDRESDRTAGQAAVQDFQPFVDAGITTFDTAGARLLPACWPQEEIMPWNNINVHSLAGRHLSCAAKPGLTRQLRVADIYGPSEGIIGKYLQSTPGARSSVQVLTKFCCFGQSMDFADNPKYVKRVR